jgi:hypothetical protein
MSLVQLQTELSTADGFARRVVVARTAVSAAKGLLVVAGIALAYNLFSTIKTLAEYPSADFLGVFLSTEGDNPVSTIWFTFLVWGPIIVLPLALIFYIYARSTAQRVDHAAFLDFSHNGYVITQRPLGFAAMNGNTAVQVQLLSHPSVSDEAYNQAFADISGHLASLDKKARKKTATSLGKVASAPLPATQLLATVPPELLLSGPIGKTEWVAVLPPSTASAKTRYFAVKP